MTSRKYILLILFHILYHVPSCFFCCRLTDLFLGPGAHCLLFLQGSWYLFFSVFGMLIFPYFSYSYTFLKDLLKAHLSSHFFFFDFENFHKNSKYFSEPLPTHLQQIAHIFSGRVLLSSQKSSELLEKLHCMFLLPGAYQICRATFMYVI